ncbi:DoxX family protein [Psychromicrobium xiongbiense]|uniref:DoxX family protein n=1 Tax=Psychromicrobium xiongbiense TaxID=3051184 RepID=UPI0025561D3E|nr:DoxX family protein [Psychromicrobium sp. YIM S02556]
MPLTPDLWWPSVSLALVLFIDATTSVRPPKFIRECLDGVGFPREWWWSLIVIKTLAVVGLIVGIWIPGIALATTTGVIVYFLAAAAAHIRARFTGRAFWLNCCGMLALSVAVLVLSFVD